MNAIPFLLAAALTPRDQWHDRWKYINRLAGIVAERAGWLPNTHFSDTAKGAQEVVDSIAGDFARFLKSREDAGADVAAIRAQERELLEGLTKRVAECLMLEQCEGINGVETALDVFRQIRGTRP